MKIFEVTTRLSDLQAALAPEQSADAGGQPAVTPAKKGSVEERLVQQGSLSRMGKYLRSQYKMDTKRGRKIQSTGSQEVDDLLTRMGFIVK